MRTRDDAPPEEWTFGEWCDAWTDGWTPAQRRDFRVRNSGLWKLGLRVEAGRGEEYVAKAALCCLVPLDRRAHADALAEVRRALGVDADEETHDDPDPIDLVTSAPLDDEPPRLTRATVVASLAPPANALVTLAG